MNLTQLLAIISPPRRALAFCLLLLLASSLIALLNPWVAGQFTNHILDHGHTFFPSFQVLMLFWIALVIMRSLLSFATSYLTGCAAEDVLARLRSRLYEHLQLLPVAYFDDQKRGNVLSILTSDSAIISNFVTGTLIQILPSALTFLGAAAMMLWLSPAMAAIVLALLPVYIVAMKLISRRIRPLSREWVDAYGNLVSLIEENLGLLPAIKSYTRERQEFANFGNKNTHLLHLSKRQLFIHALLPPAVTLLAGIGLLVLVWFGYTQINSGAMLPSDLVSLLFYAILLNQPLSQLANVYGQLQRTRGASERIMAFLEQQREPDDNGLPELRAANGEIRLTGVSFAYSGVEQSPLFQALDFHINPRETIAIVGKNGAGKSTFAHLLMRLIEPTAGTITIDGQDIGNVSTASVRSQIGLVAQHTLLLNGTVADNIGWGKAFATRDEIEAAAKAACAHDFIVELPQGYNTLIGDQGLKLSGGQRQRLSLARALLKNPPILILDEATSMFDPAAEAEFLRDCKPLFSNRTVILITHRPASLAIADRVLRLNNGKFTEVSDVGHYLRTGEL
ncbi:MAG: ABC transporter ATP-binding protein [Porticoccaceae bacterium]